METNFGSYESFVMRDAYALNLSYEILPIEKVMITPLHS